jgi:glycosyltransferase involved in cell wall biosynthesis
LTKIVYVQYTNPAGYPPLEHSSLILAKAGWQVLFLGTDSLGSATLKFSGHANITVRKLRFKGSGFMQKLHYMFWACWTLYWILRFHPDWIYCSDPLSTPVGLLSGAMVRGRIYHEHDSPALEQDSSIFMKMVLRCRMRFVRRSSIVIFPNLKRVQFQKFSQEVLEKVVCVWNCPSLEELPVCSRQGLNGLSVLYHGSIVPDRLPMSVLQALAQLPSEVTLTVVGYETVGSMGYTGELQKLARDLNIEKRITFVGAVPTREELLQFAIKSDVGLALMPLVPADMNTESMAGASNKPFDYLFAGAAVLVSNLPDWNALFVSNHYGLCCDPNDPQSIANSLKWFLDHPTETRQMGARGRQRILQEWNYETQFSQVMRLLNPQDNIPVVVNAEPYTTAENQTAKQDVC